MLILPIAFMNLSKIVLKNPLPNFPEHCTIVLKGYYKSSPQLSLSGTWGPVFNSFYVFMK